MIKSPEKRSQTAIEVATNSELSSLIVPLREGKRCPPLFCMHDFDAGQVFKNMAQVLQTDRAIYAIEYHRAAVPTSRLTVEGLAESHLKEICKLQPEGPYFMIGFSLGALVAYEIACLLAARNEKIGLLALIDIYNPAFYRESTSEAVKFRRSYLASRVGKYLNNLKRGDFHQLISDGSKLIKKKLSAISLGADEHVHSLGRMVSAYSPKRSSERLVLFRVERPLDGGTEFDHDPSLGWNSYAGGGVDVKLVSGTHATVMNMPHVIDLASKLAPYLKSKARR
jgi:thioesterase domain-containing protein